MTRIYQVQYGVLDDDGDRIESNPHQVFATFAGAEVDVISWHADKDHEWTPEAWDFADDDSVWLAESRHCAECPYGDSIAIDSIPVLP